MVEYAGRVLPRVGEPEILVSTELESFKDTDSMFDE